MAEAIFTTKELLARTIALEAFVLELANEHLPRLKPEERQAFLARAIGRAHKLVDGLPQPGDAVASKHFDDVVKHVDFYATRFAQDLQGEQ